MVSAARNIRTQHSVLLTLICVALFLSGVRVSRSADADQVPDQAGLIVASFEEPLRAELLKRGYSPRNAAVASRNLVERFAECWRSSSNKLPSSEQRAVVVQLGGKTIVTYESPCLSEFLSDVESLP
jgi:hypothetical protein